MLATLLVVASSLAAGASEPLLLPAPRYWAPQTTPASKSVSVDPMSRSDVALKYQQVYLPQQSVPHGWSGSIAACSAGSTRSAYQTAVIERVNFYRALAGLPGTVLNHASSGTRSNTQQAALMMAAQGQLNHSPGAGWACYSSGGAGAAGTSNLALGARGTEALAMYMDDWGDFNSAVGHRRWMLYPPQAEIASGDIPNGSGWDSNALNVIGGFGARPATPNGVAWPPRGFVPHQLLPAVSNRWSLSYPNASFAGATVSMSRSGQMIPVQYEPVQDGYGDNTLVWRPNTAPSGVVYGSAGVDRTYSITVSGIGGVPGGAISYTVTVMDGTEAVAVNPDLLFASGFENP